MHALLALIMTLAEVDRLELAWDAPPECGTQDEVLLAIDSLLEGATNIRVPVSGHFRILGAVETHRAVLEGVARLDGRSPTGQAGAPG